jgi:hypothetical protein
MRDLPGNLRRRAFIIPIPANKITLSPLTSATLISVDATVRALTVSVNPDDGGNLPAIETSLIIRVMDR